MVKKVKDMTHEEKLELLKSQGIEIGMYLKSSNFFATKEGEEIPVIQITNLNLQQTKNSFVVIINKNKQSWRTIQTIQQQKISEEEYNYLTTLWNSKRIDEPISATVEETCITTTEEGVVREKEKYSSAKAAFRGWFHLKLKYPEKDLSVYKCPNCGNYHVGNKDKIK